MSNDLTCVSLFAGIGGLDVAFERAGFRSTAQVEIDSNCLKLLKNKWPKTVRVDDITKLNSVLKRLDRFPHYEKFFDRLSDADVFCGGFPCQDLSVAGQRAGLDGARSGLWFCFRRIIALFRPPWVVIENVPGLLSSQSGDCFRTIISGLEKLGYGVSWRSLDAQYAGVAQRRERVFIVGSLGKLDSSQVLFESESLCWNSPPSREKRERIAPTVEGRAGRSGANNFATSGGLAEVTHSLSSEGADASEDGTGRGTPLVPVCASTLNAKTNGATQLDETFIPMCANRVGAHHSRQDLNNDTYVLAHGQAGAEIVKDGEPSLTCNHEAPILAKSILAGGHNNNPLDENLIAFPANMSGTQCAASKEISPVVQSNNPTAVAFTERTRNGGRNFEAQKELAYTLTNPGDGGRAQDRNIQQGMQVRRLTPTECERLQGFDDGWTEGFSDSVRYRMLGNSVAVPVVEWIARRLAKVIRS